MALLFFWQRPLFYTRSEKGGTFVASSGPLCKKEFGLTDDSKGVLSYSHSFVSSGLGQSKLFSPFLLAVQVVSSERPQCKQTLEILGISIFKRCLFCLSLAFSFLWKLLWSDGVRHDHFLFLWNSNEIVSLCFSLSNWIENFDVTYDDSICFLFRFFNIWYT